MEKQYKILQQLVYSRDEKIVDRKYLVAARKVQMFKSLRRLCSALLYWNSQFPLSTHKLRRR